MKRRAFDPVAWSRVRAAMEPPDRAAAVASERATLEARAAELARVAAEAPADDTREVLRFVRGAERWAIELVHVRAVTRAAAITPVFGLPAHWRGVFALRGEVLAVVDLARLYGFSATEPEEADVVVLGDHGAELGLLVDEAQDIVSLRAGELYPATRVAEGPPLLGMTVEGLALLDGAALLAEPRLFVGPSSAP